MIGLFYHFALAEFLGRNHRGFQNLGHVFTADCVKIAFVVRIGVITLTQILV